jgi:hypothetical protein
VLRRSAWITAAAWAAAASLGAGTASASTLAANPFMQQAGPLGSSEVSELAEQGTSVALSADGNTAVVGAPLYKVAAGAAFVWVRTGSGWSEQAKLVGKGASAKAQQGFSVALSADGNTALIGAPQDEGSGSFPGAVYVFTRSGSTWTEQQKLVATAGATQKSEQGSSVALSSSGSTALVGAADNVSPGVGAAFVFTRTGASWSQQGGALVGTHGAGVVQEGTSVALSGDGTTALIGGPRNEGTLGQKEEGSVWAFVESGGKWAEQAKLPAGAGAGEEAAQGQSVALSGDGNTAIVGGPGAHKALGAAWVYTRTGSTWAEQGEPLLGEDRSTEAEEGRSVSMSEDGNAALAGGYHDATSVGATWAFARSGASWTEQEKFVGSGGSGFETQGAGVALSGDGSTAIVGGPGETGDQGAFWIFARAASGEPEKVEPTEPPQKENTSSGNHETTTTTANTSGAGTTTTTTPGVAHTAQAIEELALGCGGRELALNDVYIHAGRVKIEGSAARRLIGRKVKILFDERRQVATTTVGPTGLYVTTAPLPPASILGALHTRYSAEIGSLRSVHLKLTRRLVLEPPHASGRTVTLTGEVTQPLTLPVAPVLVEQALECRHPTIVERFTPPASGRFHITLTVPADAKAAVYTLKSKVAGNSHSRQHGFNTYSLPLPVLLG